MLGSSPPAAMLGSSPPAAMLGSSPPASVPDAMAVIALSGAMVTARRASGGRRGAARRMESPTDEAVCASRALSRLGSALPRKTITSTRTATATRSTTPPSSSSSLLRPECWGLTPGVNRARFRSKGLRGEPAEASLGSAAVVSAATAAAISACAGFAGGAGAGFAAGAGAGFAAGAGAGFAAGAGGGTTGGGVTASSTSM